MIHQENPSQGRHYSLGELAHRLAFADRTIHGQVHEHSRRHSLTPGDAERDYLGEVVIVYRLSGRDSSCTLHAWIQVDDVDIDEELIPLMKMAGMGGRDKSTDIQASTPVTLELSVVRGTSRAGNLMRSLSGGGLKRTQTIAFQSFSSENNEWQEWIGRTVGELLDELITGKQSEAGREQRRAAREQQKEKQSRKEEIALKADKENEELRERMRQSLPLVAIVTGALSLLTSACLVPVGLIEANGFLELIQAVFLGLLCPLSAWGSLAIVGVVIAYLAMRKNVTVESWKTEAKVNERQRKESAMLDMQNQRQTMNSSENRESVAHGVPKHARDSRGARDQFSESEYDRSVDQSLTKDELQRKYGYSKGSRLYQFLHSGDA